MIRVNIRAGTAVCLIASIAGCASSSYNAQQANNLVAAVATLTAAEAGLYEQIIAVEAATYRMRFGAAFVIKGDPVSKVTSLYDAQPPATWQTVKTIRLHVLQQLSNYAQQVAAITTSASTAYPAAEAQATETGIANLSKTIDPHLPASVTTNLQTGTNIINSLGTAIVSAASAKEVKKLAAEAEPGIDQIQTMIDSDKSVIESMYNGPGNEVDEQKDAAKRIINALYVQPSSALGRYQVFASLPTAVPPVTTLAGKQQAVSDAMAKIVQANKALKIGQVESAQEFINQAIALAQQATGTGQATPAAK